MKPHLLGPLEDKVMRFFWNRQAASIASLHLELSAHDKIAYTTVSTIVSRLVAKKLLSRRKVGASYLYGARINEAQFVRSRSRNLIKALLGNFGEVAIASFVDELKTDPAGLKKLRELTNE